MNKSVLRSLVLLLALVSATSVALATPVSWVASSGPLYSHWVKDPANPIFDVSDGSAWRSGHTYMPMVIGDQMWFSAVGSTGTYVILGLAALAFLVLDLRARHNTIMLKLLACAPVAALPAPSLFAQNLLHPRTLSEARLGQKCFKQTTVDAQLTCWLEEATNVSGAMYWEGPSSYLPWKQWPPQIKQELADSFKLIAGWYLLGMPAGSAPQFFPDIITPTGPIDPVQGFWMSGKQGTSIYLAIVANSLAAELTGYLPWSIAHYNQTTLRMLFDQTDIMSYIHDSVVRPGYYFGPGHVASPANPPYTALLFKNNKLRGSSEVDTIARLFAWEKQFHHWFQPPGSNQPSLYPYFWGPNTPPIPDAEIITGTTYSGPGGDPYGLQHYTAGCGATTEFMKSVLRTVNIPVETGYPPCGHVVPVFPAAHMAMTHGDDPYDRIGWVTAYPGFPAPAPKDYLVSYAEYEQLFFHSTMDQCTANIGIQPARLGIKYGADILMNAYCADLASGVTHADSQVYALLNTHYSLQALENTGLWTTLANKDAALNWCTTIYGH